MNIYFLNVHMRVVFGPFFRSPIVCNSRLGLSWSEVLAGFVESLDFKAIIFWSVLTCEILWSLWKERNGEIFQKRGRQLTEFGCKLIHYHIMPQVVPALELKTKDIMLEYSNGNVLLRGGVNQEY